MTDQERLRWINEKLELIERYCLKEGWSLNLAATKSGVAMGSKLFVQTLKYNTRFNAIKEAYHERIKDKARCCK